VRLRGRSVTGFQALGNQFGTNDGDVAGCIDSQTDLPSFQADDCDTDVIADKEFFHQFPGQHEHELLPYQHPVVDLSPRLG
jgi:hypothetical protein